MADKKKPSVVGLTKKQAVLIFAKGKEGKVLETIENSEFLIRQSDWKWEYMKAAILRGSLTIVQKLLPLGFRTQVHDIRAYADIGSPLFIAVDNAQGHIAEYFLKENFTHVLEEERDDIMTHAVSNIMIDTIKLLVQRGFDVNDGEYIESSPLYTALVDHHQEIVDLLIRSGANINHQIRLKTILHEVAEISYHNTIFPSVVDKVLKLGADVDAVDEDGYTPLFLALDGNNFYTARKLIAAGCDVNHVSGAGETPILICARQSVLNGMGVLLDSNRVDLSCRYKSNTAFYYAVHFDDISLLKRLIEQGADINSQNKDNRTPLMRAIKRSKIETMQFLLENNANVNLVDSFNNTALHLASYSFVRHYCISNIIYLLMQKGCDINAKDNDGNTPLMLSFKHNRDEQSTLHLISYEQDFSIKNNTGKTALHYAAKDGNTLRTMKLLERCQDIHQPDEYGTTPLMIAKKKGASYFEMVQHRLWKRALTLEQLCYISCLNNSVSLEHAPRYIIEKGYNWLKDTPIQLEEIEKAKLANKKIYKLSRPPPKRQRRK